MARSARSCATVALDPPGHLAFDDRMVNQKCQISGRIATVWQGFCSGFAYQTTDREYRYMKKSILPILLGATFAFSAAAASAATLDDVKSKGFLQCGVNTGLPGFASPDNAGNWTGLDVDYCKAVAAAIFGDASKVKYTPLSATDRFTALQSGEIDMLARNSTWTITRDTSLGLTFTGVNYYDGQGFMVKKSLGVASAKDLNGASICVQSGTTTELNLADYFKAEGMEFTPGRLRKVRRGERRLRGRPLRRVHDRRLGPLRLPPDLPEPRRAHGAAGDHLQGAAGPGRSPGRHAVVQHRQVDRLRAGGGRGTRHHPGRTSRR